MNTRQLSNAKRYVMLLSMVLFLSLFIFAVTEAGESIKGIPSTKKVDARVVSSFAKLPVMTERDFALLAANPHRLPPELHDIPEEEFELLKQAPKPEYDGKGTFTIDPAVARNDQIAPRTIQNGLLFGPSLSTNFEGNIQGGGRPGDFMLAVGLNYIVSTANSSIRIRSKDGLTFQNVSADAFFSWSASHGLGFFDPKVVYDVLRNRYIVLFDFEDELPNQSVYWVGVSKSSDPKGGWYIYRFDMMLDADTPTTNWSDFPGLGIDDNSVYLTGNQYGFPLNTATFQYVKTRVVDKNAMYNGESVGYVDIIGVPGTGSHFTLKPALSLSPISFEYLLITPSGGGNSCQLYQITGAPYNPSLEKVAGFTVSSHGVPPDGIQKDCSTTRIDVGDARTQDPVWRNGFLYATNTVGVNIGGGAVSAVRYYKINTNTTELLTDETFGAPNTFYSYPAVTVDAAGTAYFSFSRSSADEYASACFSGKRRSDSNIQPSVLLKAGNSSYWCGGTGPRWGDFEGASIDPADTTDTAGSAWIDGNWAKAGSFWGSWIGKTTYFYHRISGFVLSDCDSNVATAEDRNPVPLATVSLHKDSVIVATTMTDNAGAYNFGFLEDSTYSLTVVLPPEYISLDVVPGSGGTSETRVSSTEIQIVLSGSATGSQISGNNNFLLTLPKIEVANSVQGGWNLVSVPVVTCDFQKSSVYPTSISRAFAYQSNYQACDTLQNGTGYWLKFISPQVLSYGGRSIMAETVNVRNRWNMVGSISAPIPVSNVMSIPGGIVTSPFLAYSGAYTQTDSILPGLAYWVKVNRAGKLVLSASATATPLTAIKIKSTNELPPSPPNEDDKAEMQSSVPREFELEQNQPNPFNPTTKIQYALPSTQYVSLKIFNVLGQEVRVLVNEMQDAGYKSVQFEAGELPSGVYLYRITAGTFIDIKKMLLLK